MMKLWNLFGFGVITLALATGCNKHPENLNGPEIEDDGEPLYVSMNLQLPMASPGTRTATGETDTEPGQAYENTVRNVLLVLASKDDEYIAHSATGKIVTGNNNALTVTSSISKSYLGQYYNKYGNGEQLNAGNDVIRLYAYCNPPQDLLDSFKVEEKRARWTDFSCEVGEKQTVVKTEEKEEGALDGKNQSIWTGNSFLMSNTEIHEAKLPISYNAWEEYATQSKPFKFMGGDLNADGKSIPVERSVARFDFKDGSTNLDNGGLGNNTYEITSTGASNGKLKVQLLRMSLVNMSKSFYYLKRVTKDASLTSKRILCGEETVNNWVVDTDWDKPHKNVEEGGQMDPTTLETYYNFRLFNDEGKIDESTRMLWNNHRVDQVLSGADLGGGYRIWRYVTENTIPGEMHQRSGASTGIVFKGKIMAEGTGDDAVNPDLWKALNGEYEIKQVDGKPIGYVQTLTYKNAAGKEETKSYPILYLFNDVLYVGWNHQVKEDAGTDEGLPLWSAVYKKQGDAKSPDDWYQEVVRLSNEGQEETDEFTNALKEFRRAATEAGFTLYQASVDVENTTADISYGPGYYCYYYYWNRHNDNGRPGTMGQMEFGVVRNNIYKLSVNKINYLGHPRRSDNDPEPPTPETPNEDAKVYLEVAVKVREWVVRENNIEF